jgi:hypothetical protein
MFKPYRILLVSSIFLCLICITIVQVKAQGSSFEAEILPAQGNADTTILIRFKTTNAAVGNVEKADIFWDDSNVELNQQGTVGADGSYNYNLTVPTNPRLSDVGNHTIRVDSSVFNYGQVTFNFTFTVTEFVPSSEYLALNATYYSLLTNYSDLLKNYNPLLANYTKASKDYTTLLNEYDQLRLNYNSLTSNYNSLTVNSNSITSNYNSLVTDYNSLHEVFSSLLANYTSLQADFKSLSSALGGLDISRNLNYILIASTTILAITSIYLAIRKPKPDSRAR